MGAYGTELPDQVDVLNRRTEAQLVLLSDVQNLIRERAALEKEYSIKLQAIARKAGDKLAKHMPPEIVGEELSHTLNEETIKRSTLGNALSFLTDSFERGAQEHMSYSEVLLVQVADELRTIERKKEETRKRHLNFYTRLVTERDHVYADQVKAKQKYYSECEEVETARQKQDRAGDDKHAERAVKQYEQQRVDMLNSKNTYLIATSVANKTKDLFYAETVPVIENIFQRLQASVTTRFTSVLQHYAAFTASHLSTMSATTASLQTSIFSVDESRDQDLFIEFNKRPFSTPANWIFEPCGSFYDTDDVSVEPEPKVFLQNKLTRTQAKLADTKPIVETKKREASRLDEIVIAYAANPSLGSVDDVLDNAIDAVHTLAQLTATLALYDAEKDVIVNAIGSDHGNQTPHTFKSSSFSIPTQCSYCKTSIWGLSKQGKTCKACGIAVHSKCELKVPADCGNPGATNGASGTSRHRPTMSLSRRRSKTPEPPSSGASSTHSFATSQGRALTIPVVESAPSPDAAAVTAKVLFDFDSSSPLELGVHAGSTVRLVEEDDGSGWVKVADSRGGKGLVPITYLQIGQSGRVASPVPAVNQGSGKFVRGLYVYDAQGDDELSIAVGELMELTALGDQYADGWYEGVDRKGKKGIFPSNYVELVWATDYSGI